MYERTFRNSDLVNLMWSCMPFVEEKGNMLQLWLMLQLPRSRACIATHWVAVSRVLAEVAGCMSDVRAATTISLRLIMN